MKTPAIILALALSAAPHFAFSQEGNPPPPPQDGAGRPPEGQPGPGGPNGQRPPNPIILALDLNKDGVIDAEELAKATESLKKLDKNGDGKLTEDEVRPARPPGGPGGPGGQQGGPGGQQGGPGGQQGGRPQGGPGFGGPGGPGGQRPGR